MDFSKFNFTELLNIDNAINMAERNTLTAISFIPEASTRKAAEQLCSASVDFARAQVAAAKLFGETMQKMVKTTA